MTAVNDAPAVVAGKNIVQLPDISEDPSLNAGSTVSALFGDSFNDATDAVTGGSAADSFKGVVITQNGSTPDQGTWQYGLDASSIWNDLPTVSQSSSWYLSAGAKLRFKPAPDYNGTPGALTLRLVDSSDTSLTNGSSTDSTSNGFSSALSAATLMLGINITTANDAPALGTVSLLTGFSEDEYKDISYQDLLRITDARDADAGDSLQFRIETVSSGTLQKWDSNTWVDVTAGTTTLATGEKLQWKAAGCWWCLRRRPSTPKYLCKPCSRSVHNCHLL